jgi:hypothetical protein
VEGLEAVDCRAAALFAVGLPERPIEDLSILDSTFSIDPTSAANAEEAAMTRGLPPPAGKGFRFRNVRGLRLRGVTLIPEEAATRNFEEGVTFSPSE